MRHISRVTLIILCSMIPSPRLFGKLSFKKLSAFFGSQPYHMVVQKEFPIAKTDSLIIDNTYGAITVKASGKHNNILLKAKKQAKKPEQLVAITVAATYTPAQQVDNKSTSRTLTITTAYAQKPLGTVDYELIIPAHLALTARTKKGNITLHNTHGPIAAHTTNGTITIINAENTIHAIVEKQGTITVENAKGTVNAETNKGNIWVKNANKHIIASATKGSIVVACSHIEPTNMIRLYANRGSIELGVPKATNATIRGKTNRGTVIVADHYVTLKPYTTKLNARAWHRFKQEVHGTLGTGEADIHLSCNAGNIKIVQAKA